MSALSTYRPISRLENAKKLTPVMPAELLSEVKSPSRIKFQKQRNRNFVLSEYIKRNESTPRSETPRPLAPSRSVQQLKLPETKLRPTTTQTPKLQKGSMFCTEIWPMSHFHSFVKKTDATPTKEEVKVFVKERTRGVDQYRKDLDRMFLAKHPEYALGSEICRSYFESDFDLSKPTQELSTAPSSVRSSLRSSTEAKTTSSSLTHLGDSPSFRLQLPKTLVKSENNLTSSRKRREESEEKRSDDCSIIEDLPKSEYSDSKKVKCATPLGFHLDFSAYFLPPPLNNSIRAKSINSFVFKRESSLDEPSKEFELLEASIKTPKEKRSVLERTIRDPFKIQKIVLINKKGIRKNVQHWTPKNHTRKYFFDEYEVESMKAALVARGRDKRKKDVMNNTDAYGLFFRSP